MSKTDHDLCELCHREIGVNGRKGAWIPLNKSKRPRIAKVLLNPQSLYVCHVCRAIVERMRGRPDAL